MQVFESKIDWWLWIAIALVVVSSVVAAIASILQGSPAGYFTAALSIALGVMMPLWIVFSTKYAITNRELRVHSGPFHWIVPLSSIASVKPTNNPLSSPALSLDRLEILYGNRKSIIVSPKRKTDFCRAIGQGEV